MRTRTIMLQARTSHTNPPSKGQGFFRRYRFTARPHVGPLIAAWYQLLGMRAHSGHGDDQGELLQAILAVTAAAPMHAQQTPVHREAQSERVGAPQQGRPLVHVLTENSGEQMLCKSNRGMAILVLFPLARMDGVS